MCARKKHETRNITPGKHLTANGATFIGGSSCLFNLMRDV